MGAWQVYVSSRRECGKGAVLAAAGVYVYMRMTVALLRLRRSRRSLPPGVPHPRPLPDDASFAAHRAVRRVSPLIPASHYALYRYRTYHYSSLQIPTPFPLAPLDVPRICPLALGKGEGVPR